MQRLTDLGLLGIGAQTADLPAAAAASVSDALIAAQAAVARNTTPGKPTRPAPSKQRDDETVRRITAHRYDEHRSGRNPLPDGRYRCGDVTIDIGEQVCRRSVNRRLMDRADRGVVATRESRPGGPARLTGSR
jgi:hypothetical protein